MKKENFQTFERYFIGDENSNFKIQHLRGERDKTSYAYGEKVTVDPDTAEAMGLLNYADAEEGFDVQFGDNFAKKKPEVKEPGNEKKEAVHEAVVESVASGELPPQEAEIVEKKNLNFKGKGGKK